MEIKGRECEEVKIGENVYYFIEKFKGKEYRVIQDILYSQMNLGGKESPSSFGVFLANIPVLFKLLCLQINDGKVEVGEEFLDALDIDEYQKVQDKITDRVNDFFAQVK